MIKREHKLTTKKDFESVFQKGEKSYSESFLVIISKRKDIYPGFKLPRFGFIASKKIGNAVKRNMAKRLLNEAVRLELDKLKPNFEAILIANKNTPGYSMKKVLKDFQTIAKKLNLYK